MKCTYCSFLVSELVYSFNRRSAKNAQSCWQRLCTNDGTTTHKELQRMELADITLPDSCQQQWLSKIKIYLCRFVKFWLLQSIFHILLFFLNSTLGFSSYMHRFILEILFTLQLIKLYHWYIYSNLSKSSSYIGRIYNHDILIGFISIDIIGRIYNFGYNC